MRGIVERPTGLFYEADFVAPEVEKRLLVEIEALPFSEVRMHGQVARRTVAHFGVHYDFDSSSVVAGEPFPDWLEPLRGRCAALISREPDSLAEALVTRYPPGATIGWHRDAPAFGQVVGVSLAAPCLLRFQRGSGTDRRVFEVEAQPRSAYVLSGASRTQWQHSIPAVAAQRFSVTFRTLRRGFLDPAAR